MFKSPPPIGYIGCSRPDRLKPISDRLNFEHESVLENVLYARAYTSEHQMELLDFCAAKFHEEPDVFKLLVSVVLCMHI